MAAKKSADKKAVKVKEELTPLPQSTPQVIKYDLGIYADCGEELAAVFKDEEVFIVPMDSAVEELDGRGGGFGGLDGANLKMTFAHRKDIEFVIRQLRRLLISLPEDFT